MAHASLPKKLLTVVAVTIWPAAWALAAWLHHVTCGAALFCAEPLVDLLLHQALVSVSPWAALVLLHVSNEMTSRR